MQTHSDLDSGAGGGVQVHTPGPWVVQKMSHCRDELWLQIGDQPTGRGPVARINCTAEPMSDGTVARLQHLCTDEGTQWANARLLAAAPELKEQLATMTALLRIKCGNLEPDVFAEILKSEAVLAKATGAA